MKKGALVIATGKEKFPTDILKVFNEINAAVVSCYNDTSIVEVLSDNMKKILGIEEKYPVCLISMNDLELILSAEITEKIHPGGDLILDLPGFHIEFENDEDKEMWEEFAADNFPKLEVLISCSKKALYPTSYFNEIPTNFEKKSAVIAFQKALNLSYTPKIVEGTVEIDYPEICCLDISQVKYIRRELK